ncbi:MAG TPA: hypothetical protein VHY84_03275, partial [Bryobacteraceae bacterium]|nr:hypothetical protein [Bryobacteraceae bacterium]
MFSMVLAGNKVTAVSGGGTWVHAPNCGANTGNNLVDCWYALNSTPGATTITGTVSDSGLARQMEFYEFSVGSGCSASLDASGSAANNNSSALSQPGITLPLTGTNDVIVQQIYANAYIASISGGYLESTAPNIRAAASSLNSNSSTAPTWTLASSAAAVMDAIAISESCATISVSVGPSAGTLTASSSQQFTATVLGTANTAVTWSISPQFGAISNSGLYTAPSSFATPQSITVTATSVADPTKSASAQVSLSVSGTSQTPATSTTFSLNELFGATWPDQPIEFRYDGGRPPSTTRMIGPAGVEVPYQWVSSCSDATAVKGCIAIRSNLPPNSNYTWTLQSGIPPVATPVNPVQTKQVGNNLEITNGLTGVRIVTAGANPSPFSLAPIQGIQLPGGSWTGAGPKPNMLYSQSLGNAGNVGDALQTPVSSAKSYTVSVVDQGPLKTVVTVNYTFNRPQYLIPGVVVINNAGTGHYTMTVTLYANSKSVLFDED